MKIPNDYKEEVERLGVRVHKYFKNSGNNIKLEERDERFIEHLAGFFVSLIKFRIRKTNLGMKLRTWFVFLKGVFKKEE